MTASDSRMRASLAGGALATHPLFARATPATEPTRDRAHTTASAWPAANSCRTVANARDCGVP